MNSKGWNQDIDIIESVHKGNHINLYRSIILLAAVVFPVSGMLCRETYSNLYDPMGVRWMLTGVCFLVVGLSFHDRLKKKYFQASCYMLIYFVNMWLFMLNMKNYFPIEFSLLYILAIVTCMAFFSHLNLLNVYVGMTIFLIYAGIWIIPNTYVDKASFLFNFTALCMAAYLMTRKKIYVHQNIMKKSMFIKSIFQEAADAMLVLDDKELKVIDCNHRATALLQHEKNELLEKTIDQFIPRETMEDMGIKEIKNSLNKKEIVLMNKKFHDMWLDITIKKFYILQKPYVLMNIADVSIHKKHQEKIEYLAYRDALTNLHNRRYGKELLKSAIYRATKEEELLGVMFVDLDGFKYTNDVWGHDVGDSLLKHVAKRLKYSVRNEDTVVRLGGDEFMIIIDKVDHPGQVIEIAERVIGGFSEPFTVKKNLIDITCSIGIAVFPEHGKDMKTLLKNADCAMYKAKESGRNNFKFFSDGP